MKKSLSIVMAALFLCNLANAQSAKETLKERKQYSKFAQTELNAKASKTARREAKTLAKQGWAVAPGQLPLDKQFDRSYKMYYEFEESGLPKWIIGDAMSPGATYDAAKMQALELAKTNIAGMIQTEVTSLIESTVGNEQISQVDATSIAKTVSASKNLIMQRLGHIITVVECYRKLPNNGVEVRLSLAYNAKLAIEDAKEIVKQQLEEKGEDLHRQLDAIWEQVGK